MGGVTGKHTDRHTDRYRYKERGTPAHTHACIPPPPTHTHTHTQREGEREELHDDRTMKPAQHNSSDGSRNLI